MSSWQVFGLTGSLLAPASQPIIQASVFLVEMYQGAFVPVYRCGAVPASHRIPFSPEIDLSGTAK